MGEHHCSIDIYSSFDSSESRGEELAVVVKLFKIRVMEGHDLRKKCVSTHEVAHCCAELLFLVFIVERLPQVVGRISSSRQLTIALLPCNEDCFDSTINVSWIDESSIHDSTLKGVQNVWVSW